MTSLALAAILGLSVRTVLRARRHLRLATELDGDPGCGDLCPCWTVPAEPTLDEMADAARRLAQARIVDPTVVIHVRSLDGDGVPLRYCAGCYQDWPCGGAA